MARLAIWLVLRMTANEHTVIVEGRYECAFDAIYNIAIGHDHRPHVTFTTDDVIPLSLRWPMITTSDRPTSVDVPRSPDTSDVITTTYLNDSAPKQPTPIPAPIDSHERLWQIERIPH